MLDLFGHLGYLLLLLGQVFVSRKEPIGFFIRAMGGFIWFHIGWQLGLTSVYLWSLVFMTIDLYAYRRWSV